MTPKAHTKGLHPIGDSITMHPIGCNLSMLPIRYMRYISRDTKKKSFHANWGKNRGNKKNIFKFISL